MTSEYDWAAYKRDERAHHKNDHENCDYRRCPDRRDIEDANEAHLFAIAVFDLLEEQDMDPHEFFGDNFSEMRDLADQEFPPWCDQEISWLIRSQARVEVARFADLN